MLISAFSKTEGDVVQKKKEAVLVADGCTIKWNVSHVNTVPDPVGDLYNFLFACRYLAEQLWKESIDDLEPQERLVEENGLWELAEKRDAQPLCNLDDWHRLNQQLLLNVVS